MSLYVGINNTKKEVSNLFVGVNGVPKEVGELYEYEGGTKRLVFSGVSVDKGLTKVDPIRTLVGGKFTKDDIGKTVYLSNSNTSCQEWVIADVNHDYEDGSVDLYPKYVLKESMPLSGHDYHSCSIRSFLNTTIKNGFADNIKNALADMPYKIIKNSDTIEISDKVKAPTCLEVGINDSGSTVTNNPSKIYPLFGTTAARPNTKAILANMSNTVVPYFTRAIYSSSGVYYLVTVTASGYSGTASTSGVAGFIRFKPKSDLSNIELELAKPNPVELLMSGKLDKSYIGRTVLLGNTSANITQEWVIADIDHEGTGNYSIDLISKYALYRKVSFGDGGKPDVSVYYDTSNIRNALRGYYQGFSESVRKNMSVFTYEWRGATISDMINCPSFTELGLEGWPYTPDNDTSKIYPLFGTTTVQTNSKAIRTYNGEKVEYWTRDYGGYTHGSCVTESGSATIEAFEESSSTASTYFGAVGIVRFAKPNPNASVDEILRTKIDPIDLLTSGRISSNDIGKIVHLYSSYTSNTEWIIADINHDGTSGTIDLVSKYNMSTSTTFGSQSLNDYVSYDNTILDDRLNRIIDGFNYDTKSILTTMNFRCGNTTLSKKVKLLSLAEVGSSMADYNSTDGTLYPIFNSNYSRAMRTIYGSPAVYWLRNTYTGSDTGCRQRVAVMLASGTPIYELWNKSDTEGYVSYLKYFRPVIRIKVN